MEHSNFYHTLEGVLEYIKISRGYNGLFLINKLLEILPRDSTVLELGMGAGIDLDILSQYYKVTGSDFSEQFLKIYKSKNPDRELALLDARTIKTRKKFNGIYTNKVLHHLNNKELAQSLERQVNVLEKNGIMCHSFWSGEGEKIENGMFCNYHTVKKLKTLFSKFATIVSIELYKEIEQDDSIVVITRKEN